MSDLIETIYAFINAESWDASREFLAQNADKLLSPAADSAFDTLLEGATDLDDRRILITHRSILQRARETSIDAAFDELIAARRENPQLPLMPAALHATVRHLQTLAPARMRAYLDENAAIRDQLIDLGIIQRQQNTSVESVILAFINANSWEQKERLVAQNPAALFSAGAVIFFEEALMKAAGNDIDTMVLEAHQRLLTRCQEIGIVEAFAEARQALDDAQNDGHDMTPPPRLH